MIRKRAKRAMDGWHRTRPFDKLRAGSVARLAQIAFGFAQARLSRRKERLLGMTIELHRCRNLSKCREQAEWA